MGSVVNSQPVLLPPFVLVVDVASHTAPPVALLSVMCRYVTVSVPLASLIVACDPGVVACKNLTFVPVVTKEPTVLVVPDLSCKVPLVIVNALVEPSVKASWQANVPPTPLKVIGQSIVSPAVVIVRLPVPVNVSVDAPEEKLAILAFKVKLPKILLVTFPKVPVNPLVNVRLLNVIPAELFIVSLPALMVNEIGALVASEFPGLTVLVVVPLPVTLT